ncbi:MAG: hypothetical protein ACREO6_09050 [Rudaea sp.]
MKYLVAVLAWTMPFVAWLSNARIFGPTNGEISDHYPTLIVAAGYAFSIWGAIFLLDVVYAIGQMLDRSADVGLQRTRPWTALAFATTSLWMIAFTLQLFWIALAIIWISFAGILRAAWHVAHTAQHARGRWWQWLPLSLHAGWVSLAVFLNVAQVIVAFRLLPVDAMLPWTLALFALAALLVLTALVGMRGNLVYAFAAIWGLAGVYVKQSHSHLPGADVAADAALALALAVGATSLSCSWRYRNRRLDPVRSSA